ncbi:MAG: DUF1993 domain-containing protein [Pseudomonadota bacterium]
MTTPLYKATIGAYLRQTEALAAIVAKGREHLGDKADAFIHESLCEDMLPFSFQVKAVNNASVGALDALESGHAGPPGAMELNDYAALETLLAETIKGLKSVTPEKLDTLTQNDVVFAMGDMKIPFTGMGYLTSFSLPNFYFHVTTAYNLLRRAGVTIGKRDFLGAMDLNFG